MSKKYEISDWEIEQLLKSTLDAKENDEFCFRVGAHATAEQILNNLTELPASE